jgi:3-oxoacyl-[acyl-carrier protein] reductase
LQAVLADDHQTCDAAIALVTGAGRRRGIATAIAQRLAETGWEVAFTHLGSYDARMPLRVELTTSTPLGRLGQPRDAANLVAFLCSPDGGWINGQLIHNDGGL